MTLRRHNTSDAERISDPGFGTKEVSANRFLNRDGSFNVERRGMAWLRPVDVYNKLITMPWWKFNLMIFIFYLSVNLVFAFIYFSLGTQTMIGIHGTSSFTHFMDDFFFSAQTITTVGYGRISPLAISASTIASIESLMGLLSFALATGLLYGRFSRPTAKILYSKKALIAPYKEGKALMFRIANMRSNQLIESSVKLNVGMLEERNGQASRQFYQPKLELGQISFFPTSWTLVHQIDEKSPFYGFTEDDLKNADAEIFVLFNGFDDTFSQTVHSRSSYKWSEIIWGARFLPTFETVGDKTILYLERISDYEKVDLDKLQA